MVINFQTHRGKVFDANGDEVEYVRRADLKSGECEVIDWPAIHRQANRLTFCPTKTIHRDAPLRFEPAN